MNGLRHLYEQAHDYQHQPYLNVLNGKGQTFFQAEICLSFQIPGARGWPLAWGEIYVASLMRSVPGTLARCE